MTYLVLFSGLFVAILALLLSLYACGRVAKINLATRELDWDAIANITGDLATTKKTIQTLNNRLNGMHSPKIAEQELLQQFMTHKQQQTNGKIIGG